MSREKSTINEKILFIERFVEVCGTNEPVKIQRLLNISYQAAKNYLQGRLPDPHVLRTIAERTPYSVHWLLTGTGEKYASSRLYEDTLVLNRQIRALIRRECVEVINEMMGNQQPPQQKIVVLQSDKLKSEKVTEPATQSESQYKERT